MKEMKCSYNVKEAGGFYQKVKGTRNEFKPRVASCKGRNGDIINDKDVIIKIGVKYFDTKLTELNKYTNESIQLTNKTEDAEEIT